MTPANSRPTSIERTNITAPADRLHEWYSLEDMPRASGHPNALHPPGLSAQLTQRGEAMAVDGLAPSPTPELTMETSIRQLAYGSPATALQAPGEGDRRGVDCLGPPLALARPLPNVQAVMPADARHHQSDNSDIFSFLAGSRPERAPPGGGPSGLGGTSASAGAAPSLPTFGCGAGSHSGSFPAAAGGLQLLPSGTVGSPAPAAGPSTGELNMILKTMQTFVSDLPKLEPGDPATRARRFQQWVLHVSQALAPTGFHVTAWWNWINSSALEAHKEFIEAPIDRREHILPRQRVPPEHSTVECWMRPRILACLPTSQRDWIELRSQAGTLDESNVLLFYALKVFPRVVPTRRTASSSESSTRPSALMQRRRRSSSCDGGPTSGALSPSGSSRPT